jgi:hypothetical protein
MDQSMQILMSKTQSESDTLYRQLAKNLNTQAGLHLIKQQVKNNFFLIEKLHLNLCQKFFFIKNQEAIQLYEKVLNSKKEILSDIRSFYIFQAHTLFNYIEVLKSSSGKETTFSKVAELTDKLNVCEQAYLLPCAESTSKSAKDFEQKRDLVNSNLDKLEKVDFCV